MKKIPIRKIIFWLVIIIAAVLRLWRLDKVPVSMFGDEMDIGYHAYSILKTGRDYSGNFMPLHFQSLAEWRTPLYLYSVVPTVALFGITPWGVRLPAAIFGILGVWAIYLLSNELVKKKLGSWDLEFGILPALLLAISPWHIQYSRAGFEVTQLLFFLIIGLYFFYKSFKSGKYLWLSMISFALTPWVYSTAKFFTPFLLLFLIITWRKELLALSKKYLIWAFIALAVAGSPIAISTLFGGGTQRFGYISVFTDPTTEPEVGESRLRDARMRGELGSGLNPTIIDRVIHNKFTFWGSNVISNYFSSFSTNFLFIKGDPNLRHSIGIGEFYKIEIIPLILGLIFFFTGNSDKKTKLLIIFWILFGAFPSAITREGGNHATRLILILPPIIFLIAYGLNETYLKLKDKFRLLFVTCYILLFVVSFAAYMHRYWIHNPWDSERWWHAGWQDAVQTIKKVDKDYDKVVISMSGEPAWIFFAGWYEYLPQKWHQDYPFKKTTLPGFGEISYIDKFYFGSIGADGIYGLGRSIDNKTLYLANAKEIGANLILEPGRTPPDLNLLKAIPFPSGEPAFYIFTKKGE